MICFLTCRTDDPETGALYTANGFADELKGCFPERCRGLFVCSDPNGWDRTDRFALFVKQGFENSGLFFDTYLVLDGRNGQDAAELVKGSDLVILAGGHVPTQNRFFQEIGLRDIMEEYCGIVIGVSAGSMNSADVVYAQPEQEGEATDPSYERFLTGLGLTKTMLLPHYQEVKDNILDGLRLFEDITLPDSAGKVFYAIPDGSYLLIKDGSETLRGEAYEIRNENMRRISSEGETVLLGPSGPVNITKMEFKKGYGWKACYDKEQGRYFGEYGGIMSYNLYELTEEQYELLRSEMTEGDASAVMYEGRHLFMSVDDRCGPPYTIIFDDECKELCPWAKFIGGGKVWPDELTDAAVELFASEENNREQRRRKRKEREKDNS